MESSNVYIWRNNEVVYGDLLLEKIFFCVPSQPTLHPPCRLQTKRMAWNSQDLEDTEYGGGGAKRGRGRGRRRSRPSPAGGSAVGEGLVPGYMTDDNDDGAPRRPAGSGWRSPQEEGARSRMCVGSCHNAVALSCVVFDFACVVLAVDRLVCRFVVKSSHFSAEMLPLLRDCIADFVLWMAPLCWSNKLSMFFVCLS